MGTKDTTVIAQKGIVDKKKIILFNGQIISSKKDKVDEIIKFEQLNIDLSNVQNTTIKHPKLQETATLRLLSCFMFKNFTDKICEKDAEKEIIPALNRRLILPFYIPVISLICSLLLIKSEKKYLNKYAVFLYSFALLIFTELVIRYTGINNFVRTIFIIFPFFLFTFFYLFLILKFSREHKKYE